MQGILATAQAALTLVALLFVGWTIVFIAGSLMERKLKGGRNTASIWSSFTWVWDNANVIGIPTLILGALYIVWAMNYGPTGLGGPTLLVLLMMGAAGMLIGFAPSLRRR
jgi:hypothetical protein